MVGAGLQATKGVQPVPGLLAFLRCAPLRPAPQQILSQAKFHSMHTCMRFGGTGRGRARTAAWYCSFGTGEDTFQAATAMVVMVAVVVPVCHQVDSACRVKWPGLFGPGRV